MKITFYQWIILRQKYASIGRIILYSLSLPILMGFAFESLAEDCKKQAKLTPEQMQLVVELNRLVPSNVRQMFPSSYAPADCPNRCDYFEYVPDKTEAGNLMPMGICTKKVSNVLNEDKKNREQVLRLLKELLPESTHHTVPERPTGSGAGR